MATPMTKWSVQPLCLFFHLLSTSSGCSTIRSTEDFLVRIIQDGQYLTLPSLHVDVHWFVRAWMNCKVIKVCKGRLGTLLKNWAVKIESTIEKSHLGVYGQVKSEGGSCEHCGDFWSTIEDSMQIWDLTLTLGGNSKIRLLLSSWAMSRSVLCLKVQCSSTCEDTYSWWSYTKATASGARSSKHRLLGASKSFRFFVDSAACSQDVPIEIWQDSA